MNCRPVLVLSVGIFVTACDGVPPGQVAGEDALSSDGRTLSTRPVWKVGGTVCGLVGKGLVLQNNGAHDLTVNTNGRFYFDTRSASGDSYSVTVRSQPSSPVQTCTVSGGTGVVGNQNVTSVAVSCSMTGTFSATGSMVTARSWHTSTLLPNGKVLIAGGFPGYSSPVSILGAELYDPATRAFAATADMGEGRYAHTATLLPDGTALMAGGSAGWDYLGAIPIAGAELYQPATGEFLTTGNLIQKRDAHTATLLLNGKVLVTGGWDGYLYGRQSAELYDPLTGVFTATGSLIQGRLGHTATLLTNGKVLIAGGEGGPSAHPTLAELYDPATGAFTATGSLIHWRSGHTATLLPNGKVLIAGGDPELYDPATGVFSATGSMVEVRNSHTATLLPGGRVLLAGGYGIAGPLSSAELFEPATETFTATESLQEARYGHTATLLPDGGVLISGGSGPLRSAEVYRLILPRRPCRCVPLLFCDSDTLNADETQADLVDN